MPKYLYQSTQDWDYRRLPRLIGEILTKEQGNEKMENRWFITVDAGGATYRVYESKGLEDVFKLAKPGLFLDVEFLETVRLQGGRTFKRFRSAVFELAAGEARPRCPDPIPLRGQGPDTTHEGE